MTEVVKAYSLSLLAVVQCLGEILQCILVYDEHALANALFALLFVGELTFLELYVVAFRQPSQRLIVTQLLVLHYKVNRLAAFSASEAFPKVL